MVLLVAVDLDGCMLRSDGSVSRRTRAAIAACQRRQIEVLPATARSPWNIRQFAEEFGTAGQALCCLGAVVHDLRDQSVKSARAFSPESVTGLVAAVRSVISDATFGWVDSIGDGLESEYPSGPGNLRRRRVPSVLHGARTGVVHLYVRAPERAALPCQEIVAMAGKIAECHVSEDGTLIDFTVRGVDKGSALREWCNDNGIDRLDVAAIGDSTADVPMLRWAGVSAAMGNASEQVRSAADHTMPACDGDGAAQFLEFLTTV